jgi:ABC-type polysaccharide/polyol phosphate export permease
MNIHSGTRVHQKDVSVYDSAHRGHPVLAELKDVLAYRHLVLQLVRRDVLTRYKRSVLGIAWTFLNPLGMMLVLTLAFSQIFRFGMETHYSVYVLSGLLSWTFFSQTTTASMVNLVWGGGLLNRIYIPRTSFAISAIGTGLVNIALSILPLFLVMVFTGVPLRPSLFFLPIPILLLAFFSLGLGLLISTFAVYFPDVAEMYQIFVTAWMYLTPIIYPEEILPEAARIWIARLNPMFYLIKLYRLPIIEGRLPTMEEMFWPTLVSVVMLVVGWWFFCVKSDEFAYRI